jgi:alcohol dehydrogenase
MLGARLCGARQVIAIDVHDDKLKIARQLGADLTFNAASSDCAEQVREATGGGAESVLEMAGSVKALDLAYRITRRGGTTVTAGLPHPDHKLELQAVSLVAEERTIKGSYIGSCVPVRDMPRYISLYQQGLLPVDRLMGDRIGLDDLNTAFDHLADGHTIRQILVP